MTIHLSRDAFRQIREHIAAAENQYEVGGLLLGHRIFRHFYIAAVTVPAETRDQSMVSFVLDGDWHLEQARQIALRLRKEPTVLGVWHSHICDGAGFSEQDRRSNRELADALGGAVSMVVSALEMDMTACYITDQGREYPCRIKRSENNG